MGVCLRQILGIEWTHGTFPRGTPHRGFRPSFAHSVRESTKPIPIHKSSMIMFARKHEQLRCKKPVPSELGD